MCLQKYQGEIIIIPTAFLCSLSECFRNRPQPALRRSVKRAKLGCDWGYVLSSCFMRDSRSESQLRLDALEVRTFCGAEMDFLAPHNDTFARGFGEAGNGLDNWLNDYLLELLPTGTPAPPLQNAGYAQAMPPIVPSDAFLAAPVVDADMLANLGQDHASSNSTECSNEHNAVGLGEQVHPQRFSCNEENDKSAQRAARVAEKNRYAACMS